MHTFRLGRSRQTDQSNPLKIPVPRHSFRRAKWPLTAPLQMPDETATHEPVDIPVNGHGVSEREVVSPSLQMSIQLLNQRGDRLETLMTVRHFVQLVPFPLNGFVRRKYIQIALVASFQIAVIAECIP